MEKKPNDDARKNPETRGRPGERDELIVEIEPDGDEPDSDDGVGGPGPGHRP